MKEKSSSQLLSSGRGRTPEAQENHMIALAMQRAEEQLMDGTASSQVITHFLKLGSTKERLEKDILAEQKKLVEAKTEALQAQKRVEELYANALSAMRSYAGNFASTEEDYD